MLESVTIPRGVTTIWRMAFLNCTSLKSVSVPRNVTSIITGTFGNCDNLTAQFDDMKAQWRAIEKFDAGTFAIHCTDGEFSKQKWE